IQPNRTTARPILPAVLWRFDRDYTVDADRRVVTPPHARLNRSRSYDQIDARLIDGIPTVGLGRALVDVAGRADVDELDRIIDALLRQSLLSLDELMAEARCSGRGCRGIGKLKRLLGQRHPLDRPPDSAFNRLVGQLLVDAGLPAPVYEFDVRHRGRFAGRVDLAYPDAGSAIECDSARWHRTTEAFENDPRRRNRLLAAGFRVLSFTWADYRERLNEVVATVRALLAGPVARGGPGA
ncbi:MAG: hypothetical protein OER95_06610, partial [Acidimicrobiia bacterium]|nr:hypothetical protein [Acidimicrobiia bacterium]